MSKKQNENGAVAAAGGPNAFKDFFAALAADRGIAFVLVPHLAAERESLMVDLLARQTTMAVDLVGRAYRSRRAWPGNHWPASSC